MFRKTTLTIAAALIALAPRRCFRPKAAAMAAMVAIMVAIMVATATATGSIVMSASAWLPAADAIGIAGSRPASGSSRNS